MPFGMGGFSYCTLLFRVPLQKTFRNCVSNYLTLLKIACYHGAETKEIRLTHEGV